MQTKVTIRLPDERHATCDGIGLALPAGIPLAGELSLEPSNGPLGIAEYEHPSFITATFEFQLDGRLLRYNGFVSQWDLWAPAGTTVQTERPDFRDELGQLDGMMDARENWSYVLPDGTTHSNSLKYTTCHFGVMTHSSSLLVRCDYYDQNPGIEDMVTIFYTRPLEQLILLRDTKVFRDAHGTPEDFDLHGGDTITLRAGD